MDNPARGQQDSGKRRLKKQIRSDRRRIFRVVEHIDFSGLIDGSPVQVLEGYVVADVESNDIFASFTFRNLSDKPIKSLEIRLLLYRDNILPTHRIPYIYSFDAYTFGIRNTENAKKESLLEYYFGKRNESPCIDIRESFGKTSYIRIPEAYFKKIEMELMSVAYADGSEEKLGIVVQNRTKSFAELDEEKKYAFSRLNIYNDAEKYHPTVVIPQKSEKAWLCCCGYKNLGEDSSCRICGRDRDWQLETIRDDTLTEKVKALKRDSDVLLRDKTRFGLYEKKPTDEELQKKIKDYEKVIQNLAEQERIRLHKQRMIIPKILIYFGVAILLMTLLRQL